MPSFRLLPRAAFSLIVAIAAIHLAPLLMLTMFLLAPALCHAQLASPVTTGSIVGTIVDPQGAAIPRATLTVSGEGRDSIPAVADDTGKYSVTGLLPGLYMVEAGARGFSTTRKDSVRVEPAAVQRVNLTLQIAVDQQEVVVSGSDSTPDSSPEKNGGAIVLKGSDLNSLSDNQDEMQQQLQAMAGSDPESGTQFYVDGFSGGKVPPKSSIREIRINQNPYSAQYDQLGYGRIEIFTKPGTDKLHGDAWMEGNDSSMNARSPFVTTQPSYYSYQFEGDLNGPINKTASYFASTYYQNAVNDSIVNAFVLDSSLNQTSFTQAISSPTSNISSSLRLDKQFGKVQTMSIRYQLQRSTQTNGGVGQFNLASQAFNSQNTEQVLQISDTQAYGAKVINETRFQYIRDRNNQTAANTAPTIAVQGAFTGGGSSLGSTRDNQDHYEFQDYVQITAGKHDLNFGGRLRDVRDSNYSTTNFNGQYTFASLAAYQITEQGIRDGLSPAAIRTAGGGASQFSQTLGTPAVTVSLFDAGLYAEDNWKVNSAFTFSYGMRFETQTGTHDHADFGPRMSAAWTIPGGKNKPPKAVLRAGGGFFYQRFQSTNLLQAERQNGTTETETVVNNPDFYPETCVTNSGLCAGSNVSAPTIYRLSPNLRSPYVFMTGIGVDKPISKYGSVSANYLFSRGEHLFLTRNINAPLPSTYDPADPASGIRPLGTNENIYEFDSEGASGRNRLVVNGNLHVKPLSLFGYYMLSKVNTNTTGIGTFPSNQYDIHVDYGRGSYDVRNRLFLGGFSKLPWGFGLNPFIIYQSSAPFNIVVGQDLNGDTQFNDRPSFATDLSRSSVYRTKFGIFDSQPIAGQSIIPINFGKGPGLFLANFRLTKQFSFGPVLPDDNPPPPPDKDAKPAKPGAKPVKKVIERKYNLGLSVSADNALNHVNLGAPIGVLGSPLFGQSTSLTTVFGSGSANRTVNLDMFFRF